MNSTLAQRQPEKSDQLEKDTIMSEQTFNENTLFKKKAAEPVVK